MSKTNSKTTKRFKIFQYFFKSLRERLIVPRNNFEDQNDVYLTHYENHPSSDHAPPIAKENQALQEVEPKEAEVKLQRYSFLG